VGVPIRQNNLAIWVVTLDASIAENDPKPTALSRYGPLIHTPNVMVFGRQPLMETSDNTPTSSPAPTSTARRSGRVTKAPTKFTPDAPAAIKRKRNAEHDDDDAENESPDEIDDVSDPNDDDADDTATEEPRRASKKKKPSSQGAKSRKPAAKKPKINGDALAGEPIHGAQLPSRPKKAVRIAIAQGDAKGLYGGYPSRGHVHVTRTMLIMPA
jgi:cohesin complex subunit SA-1/2